MIKLPWQDRMPGQKLDRRAQFVIIIFAQCILK